MNRIYKIKNTTIERKETGYQISWFLNDDDYDVPTLFTFRISLQMLCDMEMKRKINKEEYIIYIVIDQSVEWLLNELLGTKDIPYKERFRMDVHNQFVNDNETELRMFRQMISDNVKIYE